MPIEQYTYWSITINNPDENDKLIVRNPNEKYIRSMVWTPEVGEEGTKHIQGWVRFQRNQSLSFVKKLYPRAHVKPCDKDAYNENCHSYAQKNDDTTAGNHHIILHDPLPANDTLLYKVLDKSFNDLIKVDKDWEHWYDKYGPDVINCPNFSLTILHTNVTERYMVMEKAGLEKIFCSPAYERMKDKFYREIIYRILYTQQQDDKERGRQESTQIEDCEHGESDQDGESYTDEGSSEGSGDETDEGSDV